MHCVREAYDYLYEAHFKQIPLTEALYGPLDDNIITDFSKMILFPNIMTTREVFERRAEDLSVGERYVELALEQYKRKLSLDQV